MPDEFAADLRLIAADYERDGPLAYRLGRTYGSLARAAPGRQPPGPEAAVAAFWRGVATAPSPECRAAVEAGIRDGLDEPDA